MGTPQQDYDKALEFMRTAFYVDGCMCYTCRSINKKVHIREAVDIVYPDLPFLPFRFNDIVNNWESRLNRIKELREVNEAAEDADTFCNQCGVQHPRQDSHEHGGHQYCPTCWGNYRICTCCDNLMLYNDLYTTNDGGVCGECFRNYYLSCVGCHNYSHKDRMILYPVRRREDGEMINSALCLGCKDDYKTECSICGEGTITLICATWGDGYICPTCQEDQRGLHAYFFKPLKHKFLRHPKEGRVSESAFHMGFELESCEYNSYVEQEAMCHLVKDRIGHSYVYCVEDGTIARATDHEGMEVVTQPFTWQEYKKKGKDRWTDLTLLLREYKWKANLPGIGFHVHTTKAAWGSMQIYKLLKFTYSNKDFIISMAGREPTDYCYYNMSDFNEAVLVAKDKKNRVRNHYSTINLNTDHGRPSNTIEFRMFQGTLEPLILHKNIEFVYACYRFTRETADMTVPAFCAYVKKRPKEYPCLNEFLKMKGL